MQWHFAYTTLKKYRLTVITDEGASALELSEKIFEAKESAAILAFRQREDLDLFRCPGYPDDLQVLFNSRNEKPEGFEGESAWVRVKDVLNRETFTGSLLNNLVSSPMKADDTITVRLINTGSTRILIGK